MRLASVIAVAGAAVTVMTLASPADAQRRTYRGDRTESITWIDENGRARTRVTVRPRSFLDGGTEVFPGERKFTDYALPADLHECFAVRRVGPDRHASFPAADAVRPAGLSPVSAVLIPPKHCLHWVRLGQL